MEPFISAHGYVLSSCAHLDGSLRPGRAQVVEGLRHSGASQVDVVVLAGAEQVTVRVSDDGGSAAGPQAPGWGIIGMRERVELTGGRLTAAPGSRGFVVDAILPAPTGGGGP